MAYRVIPKPRKKPPFFKIAFETFENGRRTQKDIPKNEWVSHGFSPGMTLEEARAARDSRNASEKLRRDDAKRIAIDKRLEKARLTQLASLPAALVQEYETKLFSRTHQTKKLPFYWRAAMDVLVEVGLEPSKWSDHRGAFYDSFSKRRYSMSYVRTLVPLLNDWGAFYSKKHGTYFEPLPTPKGRERERIADANYDSEGPGNKESAPLTPKMLEGKRAELSEAHYAWLYLSVWFGLRPVEIDGLADPRTYRVEMARVPVLAVYQSKLTSVPRDKRWKYIPCFLKEQKKGLEYIGKGKRPLGKSVRKWFGESVGLYGGRKGFVDLMQSKKQTLEDISQWLGHTSIERTWKSYKDRQKVRWRR